MPYKRGAPTGDTNRLEHGRYTAAAIAQRKLVRSTIRSALLAMQAADLELTIKAKANAEMDKSR